MKTIQPIILCGGSGTRLWPASRSKYPKQFMQLSSGTTLFSETLNRTNTLKKALPPIIISNEEYRFYVKSELANNKKTGTIILESEGRNTAPAIALAAFAALDIATNESGNADADSLLLVLPSDHRFADPEAFCYAIETAIPAAEAGMLVTFGISPSSPETGFGYIQT